MQRCILDRAATRRDTTKLRNSHDRRIYVRVRTPPLYICVHTGTYTLNTHTHAHTHRHTHTGPVCTEHSLLTTSATGFVTLQWGHSVSVARCARAVIIHSFIRSRARGLRPLCLYRSPAGLHADTVPASAARSGRPAQRLGQIRLHRHSLRAHRRSCLARGANRIPIGVHTSHRCSSPLHPTLHFAAIVCTCHLSIH